MTMKLCDNSTVSDDDEELYETVLEGGPLFSLDGHFVGMICLNSRVASFQPWNTILENLKQQLPHLLECVQVFGAGPIHETTTGNLEARRVFKNEHRCIMGYPESSSTMSGGAMILVNTFEETFGDICGDGALSKLDKKASYLKDCVVTLASYNGEEDFFACSGFFIEWNGSLVMVTSASLVRDPDDEKKIVEDLTIMVSLPDGHHKKGQLENYSLHFNIALVSVPLRHYHTFRAAEVLVDLHMVCQVAAVGRCFASGALMATTGKLVPRSGTLDCKLLTYSTCKITKAGIGGPVVTLEGHVLGMNFYDNIGTPFMTWDWISGVLKAFGNSKAGEVDSTGVQFSSTFVLDSDDVKSIGGELCDGSLGHCYKIAGTDKNRLNRWPVPMPCWRRPCDPSDEHIVEDDRYTYFRGIRYTLY